MKRAILFDMDGVLFDSMPGHAYAWSHAMTQFGLHMEPWEAYMNEGRTGAGTINELALRYWGREATDAEKEEIYAAKAALFNAYPTAPAMPGALSLLTQIRDAGLTRLVVTGSGQKTLLGRLQRHYPGMFAPHLMVTAFDVKRGKPDPEPYLMGLQKAGLVLNADGAPLPASQAVVVENAPLGVQAAHAAGIFTIAVNTGPLPDQVLWDAGADMVFPSMQALSDAWAGLEL